MSVRKSGSSTTTCGVTVPPSTLQSSRLSCVPSCIMSVMYLRSSPVQSIVTVPPIMSCSVSAVIMPPSKFLTMHLMYRALIFFPVSERRFSLGISGVTCDGTGVLNTADMNRHSARASYSRSSCDSGVLRFECRLMFCMAYLSDADTRQRLQRKSTCENRLPKACSVSLTPAWHASTSVSCIILFAAVSFAAVSMPYTLSNSSSAVMCDIFILLRLTNISGRVRDENLLSSESFKILHYLLPRLECIVAELYQRAHKVLCAVVC